jgi:hypothetical protein
VGGNIPVDNKALLVTDFMNLKIKLTQSFGCAHRGRVCMCVLLGVSAHTCMSICVCIVFLKKESLASNFKINLQHHFHFFNSPLGPKYFCTQGQLSLVAPFLFLSQLHAGPLALLAQPCKQPNLSPLRPKTPLVPFLRAGNASSPPPPISDSALPSLPLPKAEPHQCLPSSPKTGQRPITSSP